MKSLIERTMAFCDMFVDWQDSDGGIDPSRCPYFNAKYKPDYRHMQIPLMARALYAAYKQCGNILYKKAADKYCKFYVDITLERIKENRIYACYIGTAMEATVIYTQNNMYGTEEMISKAEILYKWLQTLRTNEGVYFRCGYTCASEDMAEPRDVGYSEDLCHTGRGLVRYYEMTNNPSVLVDIKGLSNYYLTDINPGTMDGIWSPEYNTWAIGPWANNGHEHIGNTCARNNAWGWSSFGCSDFLADAYIFFDDKMQAQVADKCKKAMNWFISSCQFEDGAIGMMGKDDKWVGMAAAAILTYGKLLERDMLPSLEEESLLSSLNKTIRWFDAHTDPGTMPDAGYIEVTGKTDPTPGDNITWMMAWIIEAMLLLNKLKQHTFYHTVLHSSTPLGTDIYTEYFSR